MSDFKIFPIMPLRQLDCGVLLFHVNLVDGTMVKVFIGS